MGRLERRFRRAKGPLPQAVIETTPIKTKMHVGVRADGQPMDLADVAGELGVEIEPLSQELVDELLAAARLPAVAINKAFRHGGGFCRDRYSVFYKAN